MQRSTATGTNCNCNSNSSSSPSSQACAVCKYQRRKCTPNCPLATFFPANNPKDFLNTRKLFGVRKITKLLEKLDPQQGVIAMKSIIFQANARAKDPVGGCYRLICELQRQIDWTKVELDLVLQQLEFCKAQAGAIQQQSGQQQMVEVAADDQEGNVIDQNLKGFNMYYGMPVHEQHCQEDDGIVFQGNYGGEDIKPALLGVFEDKGMEAFPFDSKGSIHCSEKLVLKEEVGSIHHELKHNLKDTASLFTLTNGK
ncbi:hypothetical protein DITRI_Ditri10aG0108200 [Diplodiscus trichospermus]